MAALALPEVRIALPELFPKQVNSAPAIGETRAPGQRVGSRKIVLDSQEHVEKSIMTP